MNKKLRNTVLAMSTLTIMAGAAIAPALNTITEHFSDVSPSVIKMLITLPCIFIIILSLLFSTFAKRFSIRMLAIIAIILYVIGVVAPMFLDNIYFIFVFRAILGFSVGIIMPLSTGLLSYYFDKKHQQQLLGYSSAMNHLGGILATIISGYLASIGWNLSFAVYLLGLIVAVLIYKNIPNDFIQAQEGSLDKSDLKIIYPYLITMFLVMLAYMNMPTNLAVIIVNKGIVTSSNTGIILSISSFFAFIVGFVVVKVFSYLIGLSKHISFLLLMCGLLILGFANNIIFIIIGQVILGLGLGLVMPLVNSQIALNINMQKVPIAMSLISVVLYIGQFLSSIVTDSIIHIFNIEYIGAPLIIAGIFAFILFIYLITVNYKIKRL